jgi:hypothetical protein
MAVLVSVTPAPTLEAVAIQVVATQTAMEGIITIKNRLQPAPPQRKEEN